ncbi:phage portal protein [Gordonia sp. PP30]|uniref:phage portal protein n=1 Tax=Gordonia sp. PP30 TaxID=2935861 RepID=UPI001FFFFEC2|nr:phage portal protein [Gordonia sp. PP30]UQE73849.1 phage portal protein [Gordonia sp. PP30]
MGESLISASVPIVPGLSGDEQAALARLENKIAARRTRNGLRTLLYEGKYAVDKIADVVPLQYGRTAKVIGWPAKAVDLLAERTVLTGFDWPDGDNDELGLGEVWTSNDLAVEAPMAAVSSLLHGVAFLSCTAGDKQLLEPAAQIHCTAATDGSGDWNPRTRCLDSFLDVHERDELGMVTTFTLMADGQIVTGALADARWTVERRPYRGRVPVEPLVFRPRPGKRLGTSRITRPVIGLTNSAMRVAMRMEGNADVYSLPQLFLLGADSRIFKNPDGTVKTSWQIALGRMFGVPDDDKAANPRAALQSVQAASPAPHIEQLQQYAQLFAGETAIPVASLGVSGLANPTSADSYIASREDLIATAETATDVWGGAWARTMMRAAAIVNDVDVPDERWASVVPLWRPPQHQSRAAMADAGAKQLGAVPWLAETKVGLELAGLSEDQITRALAEREQVKGGQVLDQLLAAGEPADQTGATTDPAADDADPAA